MTTPTKPTDTESDRAWTKRILWTFAAVALLPVLEHRVHAFGWGLHSLLEQA